MATLNIEDELMDRLRRATVLKHGKLRGVLQEETSSAILKHVLSLERSVSAPSRALASGKEPLTPQDES